MILCSSLRGWQTNASKIIPSSVQAPWTRWVLGQQRWKHWSSAPAGQSTSLDESKNTQKGARCGAECLSGTITTNSPGVTSIRQLLEPLKQIGFVRDTRTGKQDSALLVVLLTPSYAQYAIDGSLPKQFLQHANHDPAMFNKPLDTIMAVVDRLPKPDHADVQDEGVEGLAFHWSPNSTAFRAGRKTAFSDTVDKPGWLDFNLRLEVSDSSANEQSIYRTLRIPLAQTIFSTGRSSTLVQAHYRPDKDGDLRLRDQQYLESGSLDMTYPAAGHRLEAHAPMIPLTPLRTIRECMGNIIRTVSTDTVFAEQREERHIGKKAQPASQELEKALSEYFESQGMQPQPVSVWALVLPDSLIQREDSASVNALLSAPPHVLRDAWNTNRLGASQSPIQSLINQTVTKAIQDGGRLCKVLSGGGGWGKKIGLLSLDPDTSYSTRDLRSDTGWEVDFDGSVEAQKKSALGEIAQSGHTVMFFLASTRPEDKMVDTNALAWNVQHNHRVASFGTIPSSIDDMPMSGPSVSPSEVTGTEIAPEVTLRSGVFGMLSERGTFVKPYRPGQHDTGTKVDVPFSQIAVVEYAEGVLQHMAQDGQKRTTSCLDVL